MDSLDASSPYILYTDCRTAVDLQHKPRYNKPIYTNLRLEHLQGHKRSSEKPDLNREFAILDKYVHKQLRAIR